MAGMAGLVVGSGLLKIIPDFTDLENKVQASAEKTTAGFSKKLEAGLTNVGSKMSTMITLPAVAAGGAMFKMAADAEDATSAMNGVFGETAGTIDKWAKNAATNMGLTSTEARKAATDLAIFGKAGGLAGKDLTDFATQQAGLSADLASFKGTTVEEAMTAIGAAYRGEMEPIRAYGVLLDQQKIKDEAVALGLIKEGEELDNNAKLQATRSLIMKGTTVQQGDFAKTSEGAANKMKILSAQLKEQATTIGTDLMPIGQKLLGFFGDLLAKFQGLSPGAREMILQFVGIVAAVGPVILVIGKLVAAFNTILPAAKALFGFLNANPFVLLIGAIILLVVLIVQNWDLIKAKTEALWNGIKEFLEYIWNGIKAAGMAIWNGIRAYFEFVFNVYRSIIMGVWNGIAGFLSGLWNGISNTARAVWNGVAGFFQGVFAGIRNVVVGVWEGITGFLSAGWNHISNIARGVFGGLSGFFQGVWNGIKGGVTAAWDFVRDKITGAVDAAKGGVDRALGGIRRAWEAVKDAVFDSVAAIIRRIKDLPFVPGSPIPMVTWANQTVAGMNAAWKKIEHPFVGFDPGGSTPFGGRRIKPGFGGAIGGAGGTTFVGETVINLDGRTIARVITPHVTDEQIKFGSRNGSIFG